MSDSGPSIDKHYYISQFQTVILAHQIWDLVLMAYAQSVFKHVCPAELEIFGLSLNLQSYFVCARSEGSGETVR